MINCSLQMILVFSSFRRSRMTAGTGRLDSRLPALHCALWDLLPVAPGTACGTRSVRPALRSRFRGDWTRLAPLQGCHPAGVTSARQSAAPCTAAVNERDSRLFDQGNWRRWVR